MRALAQRAQETLAYRSIYDTLVAEFAFSLTYQASSFPPVRPLTAPLSRHQFQRHSANDKLHLPIVPDKRFVGGKAAFDNITAVAVWLWQRCPL
jgi:hypothetical protein